MRLRADHYIWLLSVVLPWPALAYIMMFPLYAVVPLLFMLQRCYDRQFGNGHRFFWVRQTLLVVSFMATTVVGSLRFIQVVGW